MDIDIAFELGYARAHLRAELDQTQAIDLRGDELYKVFERAGAPPELLVIIESYGFAQPDAWVLEQLKRWNAETRR